MIEINLSPSKKSGSIANIAGMDLSLVNVKMVFIALLILFIPEGFLVDFYDSQIQENNNRVQILNKDFREVSNKVRGLSNIQQQVDALNEQEEKLSQKLNAVKSIINKRSNPFQLLQYVTQNIPEDVWVTHISINDKNLLIKGHSKNWKSIGAFLENLKNSIFFSKQITYSRPEGAPNEYRGQRVEVYEINATILRFK
jgi:Tfp pilus assembly protein PilN